MSLNAFSKSILVVGKALIPRQPRSCVPHQRSWAKAVTNVITRTDKSMSSGPMLAGLPCRTVVLRPPGWLPLYPPRHCVRPHPSVRLTLRRCVWSPGCVLQRSWCSEAGPLVMPVRWRKGSYTAIGAGPPGATCRGQLRSRGPCLRARSLAQRDVELTIYGNEVEGRHHVTEYLNVDSGGDHVGQPSLTQVGDCCCRHVNRRWGPRSTPASSRKARDTKRSSSVMVRIVNSRSHLGSQSKASVTTAPADSGRSSPGMSGLTSDPRMPPRVDGPSLAASGEPPPEPELPDRSSAEFAHPFRTRVNTDGGQRFDRPTQVG